MVAIEQNKFKTENDLLNDYHHLLQEEIPKLDVSGQKKTLSENDLLNNYRHLLQEEMIKLGASEQELKLIKDATIRNAIKRNRKPEDVAWAILQ